MDIFSFILGILLTVATMYIIRCAKANKKVHRHILGRGKTGTTFYNGQSWAPPYPMPPTMGYPDPAPPPTAPYPGPTKAPVAIPWPIQ